MPRTDRGVAQRYAARKRRRRSGSTQASEPSTPPASALEQPDDIDSEPTSVTPFTASPRVAVSGSTGRGRVVVNRRGAPARTFASYSADYAYVGADLRRVGLVAGGLLTGLILLSLVIR